MSDTASAAAPAAEPVTHMFEFRGRGGEFFRIWIVNIVLTILTFGIYSAWAKVRTTRYFYGNAFLAGHPFDYHASAVRILIGRIIAIALLIGYSVSVQIRPLLAFPWAIVILFATPWLVVSSLRFSARNSSYRNVRFNFVGTLGGAASAYILWPIISVITLFTTAPLARRARDYFYINNHTFGGKPFFTEFSGARIYMIYVTGVGLWIVTMLALGLGAMPLLASLGIQVGPGMAGNLHPSPSAMGLLIVLYVATFSVMTMIFQAMTAMILNLAIGNTELDGRHNLICRLSPLAWAWIALTNLILTLVTLGFFYPWARVRLARYQLEHMGINARTNLDEFTSEAIATQGAIGEEIAGFFDLGIGL